MKLAIGRLVAATLLLGATPASAQEVNVYTYREPGLIKPLFDKFTAETGIKVNTVFASSGLEERIATEGANSPADLLISVDVARLDQGRPARHRAAADLARRSRPRCRPRLRDPDHFWVGPERARPRRLRLQGPRAGHVDHL